MGKTNVQREDEKQAAMAGLQNKQLTTPGVEKHLADFGVAADFATHNPMRALSAGQKVKVVLGAAMWQNPHILVIDEPTNYLDRDALGALTEAIEGWGGGVVVISHNLEFCNRVATEKWIMDAGHLRAEGGEYVDVKLEGKGGDDEVVDASGNVLAVNRDKKMDRKDLKKAIKDLEKKLKDGAKNKTLTEEETWALQDKLNFPVKAVHSFGSEHALSGYIIHLMLQVRMQHAQRHAVRLHRDIADRVQCHSLGIFFNFPCGTAGA